MNDRLRMSAVVLEPVERCPLCKAAERTLFERAPRPPEQIHLMRCDQCGFIYTSAVVSAGDVARVYATYSAARDVESAQLREQRLQMYTVDATFARRYLRPGDARLLDVGSGTGDFAAQFSDALELHGVEVDATARAACARAHPALRLYADLRAIPQSIAFDAIVFRGTLQYMPDLSAVAAWCSERLRSSGRLFILATPNAESILAQMQREQWVLANKAEHRYWFTRRHLLRLFGDGFRLVTYDLPYLGTPYEDYSNDLRKVIAMIENPQARADRVPFFGSMMNVVLEKS
jgi:SAM-dependent methyltransferase/rubredoxin